MNPDEKIHCISCGAPLVVAPEQQFLTCPYCGASYETADLLNESDAVRTEKIRSQAYRDVEQQKIQYFREKQDQREKQQAQKLTAVDICFAVFFIIEAMFTGTFFIFTLMDKMVPAAIVSCLQTLLLFASFLMCLHLIPCFQNHRRVRFLTAITAHALILPFFFVFGMGLNQAEEQAMPYEWDDLYLTQMLPEYENPSGKIICDDNDQLDLYINDVEPGEFRNYISRCRDMGYCLELESSDEYFTAFNKEGYELILSYFDYEDQMSIILTAPLVMEEVQWPVGYVGDVVPAPESNLANREWIYDGSNSIYVGNTSLSEFQDYCSKVREAGFNLDASEYSESFYADNAEGYHVIIQYKGNHVMGIQVDGPQYP